jgi:ribosome-binding protein aMBF1 (putative translation factor)
MAAEKTLPTQVSERVDNLGHRVRVARVRRGMSIAELAAKAGLNRNTLSALEQPSIRPDPSARMPRRGRFALISHVLTHGTA